MASVKEILNNRIASGEVIPDVVRVVEDYPAETDQIAFAKIAEAMPDDFPDADMPKEIAFPSVSVIAKNVLGLKDDNKNMKGARTAEQKFIQDFPKNVKSWRKTVEGNEDFGKRGWATVKKVWQSALNDATEERIRKDREKILAGEDIDGAMGAIARAGGFASKIFTPRQREALIEGRDPSLKDYAGDAIEDALMMVPASKFSKVLGYAPKVGSKLLGNKVATNIFGNAVAPVASEAMDAVMRGEDDPNVERQDFSLGDALMGAATNIGVNYGLLRNFGQGGRVASGELVRGSEGGIRGKIRDIIQQFGKSRVERGLTEPTTRFGKVVDFAEQAAPTFIVNKYGKDSDANYALTALGGAGSIVNPKIGNLADEVKKWPEEDRQEMQDRKTRAKISDVLGKEALTPKDEFYLGVIAQDPSVVKFGYADENHSNDDFKLWLLTRGNDLLKGTAAHRKTWEIGNE